MTSQSFPSRSSRYSKKPQKRPKKKHKSKRKNLLFKWIGFLLLILIALLCLFKFQVFTIHGDSKQYHLANGTKVELQTINFKTYLLNADTQKKLTGLQTLDNKQYYFNTHNGEMVHGLKKLDDNYYYFTKDGSDDAIQAYEHVASNLKSDNSIIEKVISSGSKLVGKSPYVYGGGRTQSDIAKNRFDCSSFVSWFYRKAGQPLVVQAYTRTSLLATTGTSHTWDTKERGDLLVTPDGYSEERQHVAIYLGGNFILHDAASQNGVTITRLNQLVNPKTSSTLTWEALFKPGYVQREV
ncbi:gamma-glutamyl-diamino acid-endopeptidase [Weissella coleopterorum]|uniref:Gamma-glutamyl-diamino acid-endopeptidase n=1 Tax=Weissella coleopterorum TaxID=2714949 RepID=A0A6G8B0Y8_9LACO|nr:NlpC/P60 family protein [Weissella coleopterorum]QIL50793.1 gamma-glutamyl-diamino acid-endopeptidase [Weissella coleopterorum]